jgi:transcription-repair coupling factor (superfamily II helicase)
MLLQYAEDAKLYVPVDRLDLVQKFGVAEGGQRTLDKLGGPDGSHQDAGQEGDPRHDEGAPDLYAKRKAIPDEPSPRTRLAARVRGRVSIRPRPTRNARSRT